MTHNYKLLNGLYWLSVCLLVAGSSLTRAQTVQAPTVQWQSILGPAFDGAYPPQAARARENGYAISYSNIIRLSESGSTLWQTTIPNLPDFPSSNTPTFITSTPDGGFVVLVYSNYKWSLAQLNTDGAVLWIKPFVDYINPNSSNSYRTFTSLISTADGGFMLVGTSGGGRGRSITEVYKFDSSGNNTLKQTIGVNNPNDARPGALAGRVVQTSDGNYLLVGRASDPVNVTTTLTAWTIKIDQQLNTIWQKYTTGQILYDVIVSPYDNNLAIAVGTITGNETSSFTITANGDITEGVRLPNRVNSPLSLIVADSKSASHTIIDVVNERQGDLRLQNIMGQNLGWLQKVGGSSGEGIKRVFASNDGGYLVVGTTASTDGNLQGKTTTDLSAWIVKLGPVSTGDIHSVRSGNWNDPSVWSCNCIPADNNVVVIEQTHTIVLDSTMPEALCQNLKILGTFSALGSSIFVKGIH